MVKHINLVFQGGGVRGAAYVGALETLPDEIRVHTVAGTSAGSIVAGLLAIGKKPSDIEKLMRDTPLSSLLDGGERNRASRLWALIAPEPQSGKGLARLSSIVRRVFASIVTVVRDVRYVAKNLGMHRSDKLKEWLDEIFEDKKFRDIKTEELLIVASDVSGRAFQYFKKETDPDMPIASAVLASVSIPIFFKPVETDGKMLVDGGVLSNFPAHLFATQKYPTIGLRLRQSRQRRVPIRNIFSLVGALAGTMTDAHDKIRIPQAHFHEFSIDTGSISSFDFGISDKETTQLVEAGRACGKTIDWDSLAAESPVYKFNDVRPYDLLSKSLSEMQEVLKVAESKKSWCEQLEERVEFDYYFEPNWGSRFEFQYLYTVVGPTPFMVRRFGLIEAPAEPRSMVDYYPAITPLDSTSGFMVHAVPWCANDDLKGFCLFMAPAITQESGPQGFRLSVDISKDHLEALRADGEDKFPWKFRRRAHRHDLIATVRFWSHQELGAISITAHEDDWVRPPAQQEAQSQRAGYVHAGEFSFTGELHRDYAAAFTFRRGL